MKKIKVAFNVLVVLLLVLTLTACGQGSNSETEQPNANQPDGITQKETVVLKFSDINAEQSPAGVFCNKFAELVEKKTEGRVKVENYFGGTLTGNSIEGTQTGIAHFSQHDVSEITDLCPLLSILEAPYLYDNDEQLYQITSPESPIMEKINNDLKGKGVILLTTYSWGNQNLLTTSKPVYSESDLKGLKIRVIPSKIFIETMSAMGATPTPMSWGEVITSLVTNLIDGTGMPISNIVPTGLHEIAKYCVMTEHNPTLSGIFMNEAAWDSLSPEDQKAVAEAGNEARYEVTKYVNESNDKDMEVMLSQGVTIIKDDELKFDKVKIRETVFEKFKDEWGDTYNEILEILDK
ncbi:MAG: TRAP transporter substrate-binding protein [Peptococcales bacterium]|jgi:tripartite ATP-independent transporter DctP family solute receptor